MCVILSWMVLSLTLSRRTTYGQHGSRFRPIEFLRYVRGCEMLRNVLQADTIVVSCGLANFDQSSWSTHRRHDFWGSHDELESEADYDKCVDSFKDNNLECAMVVQHGRSTAKSSMIRQRQELEETHWSKSEDHEVHFGVRELPRAARSSVRRHASYLLQQKHRDHDMQERTTSLCCER